MKRHRHTPEQIVRKLREGDRLLGVPAGTVKSRIRSGLARLRSVLVEAGIDPRTQNTGAVAAPP